MAIYDGFKNSQIGKLAAEQKNSRYLLPEYEEDNDDFGIPGAEKPADSDYLKGAYEKSRKGAQDYAKNLRATGDKIYGTYAEDARRQLPGMIQKQRESFNSRGLLHSGMERNAEAGTVGAVTRDLAEKRSGINQELNQNLKALEAGQFGTAGLIAAPGPQSATGELQRIGTQLGATTTSNLQNAQLIGSILGGAASVGGGALANNMQANGNNPAASPSPGSYVDYNTPGFNRYVPRQTYT